VCVLRGLYLLLINLDLDPDEGKNFKQTNFNQPTYSNQNPLRAVLTDRSKLLGVNDIEFKK
jgi:hypothetical protein